MFVKNHVIYAVVLVIVSVTCVCSIQESQAYWRKLGEEDLTSAFNIEHNENVARNVILFIGDGMGPETVTTARIYGKGEKGFLAWEKFNHIGAIKTYSANKLVPDSCSTATALFCGVKANQWTAGVDASVEQDDCKSSLRPDTQLSSFLDWALQANKSAGFVTTTRVSHATPSATYAHTPNREWECEAKMPKDARKCKDIARQLIEDAPGRNFHVIMGGGRQVLQSNVQGSEADPIDTYSCYSKDGRNLIDDWKRDKKSRNLKHSFVSNNEELLKLDKDTDYVLGVFANGHLKNEHARDKSPKGMPSLRNMTEKAIQILSKNTKGYVLMVEGGLIDQSHHRGHARQALDETVAFSDTIDATLKLVDTKDTLVIVTSDHAHSLVFVGYALRGESILGIADKSKMNDIPYTSLLYGTGGPNNFGYSVKDGSISRKDPTEDDTEDFNYSQQAAILNNEVTHSGTDVLAYATGPMSHLVHSVREQTFIAYLISYAAKIGPLKDRNKKSVEPSSSRLTKPSDRLLFTMFNFLVVMKLLELL